MLSSQQTFRFFSKSISFLAITVLVLTIVALFLGDSLVLPWYGIPTYVKTPLFLEYFRIGDQPFGILADQIVVWQHFSTGDYAYLLWTDYLVLGGFFLAMVSISVTLTYLSRSLYLFCTGLMLLVLMQLNLSELGLLPDYISYICLLIFVGSTYFFQSIKTQASLALRTFSIIGIYLLFAAIIGWLAPILSPVSGSVAFGLFAPLMLAALLMIFVGGDTMQVLFSIATKNSAKGKNGLIHFMSIGLMYIVLLILLFLEKTGGLSMELWLINPYVIFIVGLICGQLSLNAKIEVSDSMLPAPLIRQWLYPAMALLALSLIVYAELSGNDSLSESIQISILTTHLAGAAVYYIYAFINFTPQLLSNEKVANFFAGFRAPLLTARVLQLIFIISIFFYLDSQPYYQARAGRYVSLGALAENLESDLLASQYYEQASFYDFYGKKANYALGRLTRNGNNESELIEYLKKASVRDKSGKATIALSNHYSDKNQLFSKLITLKNAQHVNERLTNNLGIAHFEFGQYDSSLMALERSLSIKAMAETETNYLALSYHIASIEVADKRDDASGNERINHQAVSNKKGLTSTFDQPLSADSLLSQEELFYLYNLGLNRNQADPDLIAAYEYYLANRRNTGLKDFLLLGHAIQVYEAGEVNKAIESMAELLATDYQNRARHAFTLGLWTAQQGAHLLAKEYLDMAISGNYRVADAEMLKEAISEGQVPSPTREEFALPGLGASIEELKALKDQMGKNAFNTQLILDGHQLLKKEGVAASERYQLLLKAITANPYELALVKAYAFQAIESGLASFGRNALLALKDKVDKDLLNQSMVEFDEYLDRWRSRQDVF